MKKTLTKVSAFLVGTVFSLVPALTVHADSLDFTEVASGSTDYILNLSNATLTTPDTVIEIFAPFELDGAGDQGAVCAAFGDDCYGDMEISFTQDIMGLSFQSIAFYTGDKATVTAFKGADMLGSIDITSNGLIDFTGFGILDRLVFEDSDSIAGGVAYTNFDFTTVTAVPLPAALPLFGAALAGMGIMGWKRRKNA